MDDEALQIGTSDILKVRFDLIAYNVVMETIERWRRNHEQHYVTITNPHSVMMCSRDTEMRKATEMAGMTLPDSLTGQCNLSTPIPRWVKRYHTGRVYLFLLTYYSFPLISM